MKPRDLPSLHHPPSKTTGKKADTLQAAEWQVFSGKLARCRKRKPTGVGNDTAQSGHPTLMLRLDKQPTLPPALRAANQHFSASF